MNKCEVYGAGQYVVLLFVLNKFFLKNPYLYRNSYGTLGIGSSGNCRAFTRARFSQEDHVARVGIAQVSSGYSHHLVLLNDGTVYGCGSHTSGELANYEIATVMKNKSVSDDQYSGAILSKLNVPPCSLVCALANSSVFVLRDQKTVMTCGTDSFGQNGNVHAGSDLKQVVFPDEVRPICNLHGGWHHCILVFGYLKTQSKFNDKLYKQVLQQKICDTILVFKH